MGVSDICGCNINPTMKECPVSFAAENELDTSFGL